MKKILIIIFTILAIISIGIFSTSLGKEENNNDTNTDYEFNIGKVSTETLNIRSGLGVENGTIGTLSKDDTVHIYGKVNNWYIVKTENNLVGAVSADYIDGSYEEASTVETSSNIETAESISNTTLSQDEQIFFNLINNKRIENNLPEFELDENLLNVARLKCQDIVKNKYFSHTSPTYGSIFEMLNNNNIYIIAKLVKILLEI